MDLAAGGYRLPYQPCPAPIRKEGSDQGLDVSLELCDLSGWWSLPGSHLAHLQ
jgi:hypothetical protein